MNEEESQIHKGMTEFYQRKLKELPVVPEAKPFEVKVIEQRTESIPFKDTEERRIIEDEQPSALAPPPPGITSVNPNLVSSAGGDTVTITGQNFQSGATVKIAGNSASSVNFVNTTTLTCVTPSDGVGYVTVEVTNPGGQTVSGNNLLRYTDFPDNFVLAGTQLVAGYQGCALGPSYQYFVTARLGNKNFTPPAGVVIYAWIGLAAERNTCGLENPFGVQITNGTGPTVATNFGFATRSTQPGDPGNGDAWFAIWASRDGTIGNRYSTYGDPSNQPNSFNVHIDGGANPGGGGGSGEYFAWSGTNPNSGHFNPWSWSPDETIPDHPITIKRMLSNGTVNTGYSGTVTLTDSRDSAGSGTLIVSRPNTAALSSGTVTFSVRGRAVGSPPGSGLIYFHLSATDGTITNKSPSCTAAF